MISIPAAFIMRGSKIGATFGTLLTNHFTVFIIYPAQCYVGSLLIGGGLSWQSIEAAMESVLKEQSFSSLWALGPQLVVAFFLGGAILTAVMTPLTYIFVKRFVDKRRMRKLKKK
jgi:uncharacterized protein (DUF2062 family)